MKRNILFKTLVDVLFIFQFIGVITLVIVMPFGDTKIQMIDQPVVEWSWALWLVLILSFLTYIIFILGLYHLRKVARYLLVNKYFDLIVVNHLKRSGLYFVVTGIFSLVLLLMVWLVKIMTGKIALYDSDITLSFFIITIGLFFIIQSDVILNAKNFKDDSELTI
ncbi:DUF2975 domain-containing protein [Gelidibacter gilvus]|uniref:DUF2975 domain-containing protein n=1 Tax=Gelidibacter gilvus TaxID=59602 RepID=A0A4Q0XLE4_9FLAO|nr:DUF2975 domain-containing protein [Gelidibacter gilvus]RXJ52725.1 DUF2975 domain-containing protein [Gelidibacter gilvus]